MARIRSVSPGLRISETAAQWDREARYAWVLLWGYLDDYGRGLDNAKVIAADLFPLDDDVTHGLMDGWLSLFEESGAVCRYEQDEKRWLHCTNWSEYQKPQHPGKVRIPPCPEHEPAAHEKWSSERSRVVSRKSHEDLLSASPTRGRGSKEMSEEVSGERRGGQSSGSSTPPRYSDHCPKHVDVATPGACGDCKDVRLANAAGLRPLTLVSPTQRCLVHAETDVNHCRGCAADRKAAESA
jgi:hypothetical protein